MQTLDVISVNLWQTVISLLNLVLLFLLVKKFLFKPVKKVLEQRQKEIDDRYDQADAANAEAHESRRNWEEKLAGADAQADDILQTATENARRRGDTLVAQARAEADSIIRMAQNEAKLERQMAAAGIKQEIVEVSGALAQKLLEREINTQDHRALIDSFIEEIGDENG